MTDSDRPAQRLYAIDALRGVIMIIMALDHVRDFFHASAASFSPTDLTRTTPVLFFTRWITHFCLPVFMFAAGMGAFLWYRRGHTRGELARFLLTRGLWFIFLELTIMQFAYYFNFHWRYLILLLILWIFGICMVAMSALIYLPVRWMVAVSAGIIVFHNMLDGIRAQQFGASSLSMLWSVVHQPGVVMIAGKPFLVTYTALPWIGVMSAGFCFGQIFLLDPHARQSIMLRLGTVLTFAFIVIRFVNIYADPVPWSHQKSVVFTVLSFLNCTKYPGSLDFLLMTLGPSLLVLSWFDRTNFRTSNPLIVFGRTPFFYFVLHFYLIHALFVAAAYARYGAGASSFIFNLPPTMGGPEKLFPPGFGYKLTTAYGLWIVTVLLLYPVCRWFASIKALRRDWWLSYL